MMKIISRLLLIAGFILVMGCGDRQVENNQQAKTDAQLNLPASQQVEDVTDQGLTSLTSDTETTVDSELEQPAITQAAETTDESPVLKAEQQVEEVQPQMTESQQTAKATDQGLGAPLTYVEGTHYERLRAPVATADPGRIEVVEVFWYGCSHCYIFESKFAPWKKTQADDVLIAKSPAIWDNRNIDQNDPARYTTAMANHARIYYTAKALNALDTITPAAFLSLHNNHRGLRTEDEIATFFMDNGVARKDFERTFMSFGVTNAVRQAEARQSKYQVQGTPELVVNGTYRISAQMTGNQDVMLDVTNFLIEKIRRERQ